MIQIKLTLFVLSGFFLVMSLINGLVTMWTGTAVGPLFLVAIPFGALGGFIQHRNGRHEHERI